MQSRPVFPIAEFRDLAVLIPGLILDLANVHLHCFCVQLGQVLASLDVFKAKLRHLFKGVLQRTFFISTNERLMYKFYKNCNYFIFK